MTTPVAPRSGDTFVPRVSRRRREQPPRDPIKAANEKSDALFIAEFLRPSSSSWTQWVHPRTGTKYTLQFLSSLDLPPTVVDACLALVAETSGEHYRRSSVGWHARSKRAEMQSPDLWYICVLDEQRSVRGFTSFMPTYENDEPVVYVYEIHLKAEVRGTGLGRDLMSHVVTVAENIPSVRKVMLRAFVCNVRAMDFYHKMGFARDTCSPQERRLRGGKVVKPDMVVLSRETSRAQPN